MRWLRLGLTTTAFALTLGAADSSQAFSTRVHILLANDVRQELVASGGAGIPLRFGNFQVTLSAEDAQALSSHPLEFRAGAVGPDNMAFPGMTDPSHAIGQRPYEQCQLLYEEAILPEEKAYAMGCFLHGATDAIAHHYVNTLTGETFTLTPITSARQSSWSNVVRHITAESMIQEAALGARPEAFTTGQLSHKLPKGFIQRAYLNEQSPLWQMMAKHAKGKLDAARAANPGASLVTVLPKAGLAPADHLVLTPVYLREIDDERKALEVSLKQSISQLQNPATSDGATLKVGPGSDGKLGTSDDTTACSASCATLYAKYKLYVALFEPRFDAGNNPLPSAFEKLSEKLESDLFQFLPAYLDTVENLSNKLNEPTAVGQSQFTLNKAEIAGLFSPMTTWAKNLTTIDYQTVTMAILPDWFIKLDNALKAVGVNISIPNLLAALLDPVVTAVRGAIETYVIDEASAYVGQLVDEYQAGVSATEAEFTARLTAAAPPGLGGHVLDHFFDSGLYGHAFNVAAAAIANHQAVLPVGNDEIGIGPATFDASHTASWMQVGLCDYLRQAVFPLGVDATGAMSVKKGDTVFAATLSEDAPVECHDGSLSSFAAAPTVDACLLVDLPGLIADPAHRGTVSRAHPPALAAEPASCTGLVIAGLPGPPPGSGGFGGNGGNGGNGGSGASVNAGKPGGADDGGGCGCRTVPSREGAPAVPWLVLVALGLLGRRRRRPRPTRRPARRALAATLPLSLLLLGCGDDGSGGGGAGAFGGAAGAGALGGAAGGGAFGGAAGSGGTGAGGSGGTGAGGSGGTGATGGSGGTGGSAAQALLNALGTSVWHGTGTRKGKQRQLELRFDASSLLWAEIVNPYGPSRWREMRIIQADADGQTLHATINTPAGWPANPDNGKKTDYVVKVIAGPPKKLEVTSGGVTETFDEGPTPQPQSGLTAIVRVFQNGGTMAGAYCESGTFTAPNRAAIWEFARGKSTETIIAQDVVAGVPLSTWTDPTQQNQFAVTDIPGFDQNGGTNLSDQFNFIVLYVGTITHGGGSFSLREKDDDVRDGLWAFLGSKVGSSSTADVFLEVHGKATPDLTADAPSAVFPSQALPIEVMVLRCSQQVQDVDVEANQGSGFKLVGTLPTQPKIDTALFPPAL